MATLLDMTHSGNRHEKLENIKQILRKFPLTYNVARRTYRLFRGPDPTIQQRIVMALGQKRKVFFLQVGSNDGLQGDPIHDLIINHKTWAGIFIEPVEFLFQRLKKNYEDADRFVFENVAIGNEKGTKRFFYVSDKAKDELELPYWHDQLGSFDKNHILQALGDQLSPYIIEEEIECLPLQDVLDRNQVAAIDLIHIDTEGFDYKVLSQVDLNRYKPSVILFEHSLLVDGEMEKARSLLHKAEYRLFEYGADTLAVRWRHRSFWIL